MKQSITYTLTTIAMLVLLASCDGVKRKPGNTYMPDMAYSRAYESYPNLDPKIFTDNDSAAGAKIYYDRRPVKGAVKRGQLGVFNYENDTTAKKEAGKLNNPLTDSMLTAYDKTERVRLFNIYCAICHGTDMKGNGPIVASGKWAGVAANLMDVTKFGKPVYGDGEVFHSITYGKNQMGGYASALNNRQRWMLVSYIRSKQDDLAKAAAKPATKGKDSATAKTTVALPTPKPTKIP